jgi:hypothetical protein
LNEKYLLSKLCNSKVVGLPLLDNFWAQQNKDVYQFYNDV